MEGLIHEHDIINRLTEKKPLSGSLRILIPLYATYIIFVLSLFLLFIPQQKKQLLDHKKETIHQLTNSVLSLLYEFDLRIKKGKITPGKARKEAARAGEAGKGFAVVAGEIKALAQQTAEAQEISSNVSQAAEEMNAGSLQVNTSADTISKPEDAGDKANASIRVNVKLLDTLMTLAGELVLSRNQLLQGVTTDNIKATEVSSQQIDMITSELHWNPSVIP